MKQIRLLAQYYVDLMMKLGLVRFSMLLALALARSCHCGTNGGNHGAAWSGRKH